MMHQVSSPQKPDRVTGTMVPVIGKIFSKKTKCPDPPAEMYDMKDPEFIQE